MDNHDKGTNSPSDHPITEVEGDNTYSNVLRVKADPPDVSAEERMKRIKALAGAIAHGMRRFGEVHVRSIGKDATYKAVRALIEARSMVAVHCCDLYTAPGYIVAEDMVGKDEMTGISFLVVGSTSSKKPVE